VGRIGKKISIGLTYDLRDDYLKEGFTLEETAEFDLPDTIAAIERVILDHGFIADRIGNIQALIHRLARGDRWDLVFNLAEGMYGFGREAQIPAVLDAYKIPYTFSDPLGHVITLHKGITKQILRHVGIPTPDFCVVSDEKDIEKINLPFPVFAKPIAEGTGKGINAFSKITHRNNLAKTCKTLLKDFHQPVLIETYMPGREFTVGILGTGQDARALGALEVILKPEAEKNAYSYENKEHYDTLVQYVLVKDREAKRAMDISLKAWRTLDLKDAGRIDLRSDTNGVPHFLEVNSLAGLHPIRSDLPILCSKIGMSYHQLITSIIQSAFQRGKNNFSKKANIEMKRIVILHSDISPAASPDELDCLVQAQTIAKALRALHLQPVLLPFSLDLQQTMMQLKALQPYAVFNLVETVASRGSLIHFAPALLDMLKIPYTGCPTPAVFQTSNKPLAKK